MELDDDARSYPPGECVWLDARGLQRGFKEHAGRGIGTYVASLVGEIDATATAGRVRMFVERGAEVLPGLPAARRILAPAILPGHGRLATQLRQQVVLAAWLTARAPAAVHFAAQTDAAAFARVRSILSVHDVFAHREPLPSRAGPRARFRIARALERLAIRRATRLIVPSRVTADELALTFGTSLREVAVIPLAPGAAFDPRARPGDAAVRARLRLPERYLLHAGGADPRKRVAELVAAFDRIARHDATLALVLVGPTAGGTGGADLLRAVDRAAARDRVIVTGMIDGLDLPAVYRGAAAVVLATRHEGFGFPVVEAFASGVPVVATAAPAIVEVAMDAARLVPLDDVAALADAVREVLADPALAARLREDGLARAEAFRWSAVAEATLAVYEEATGLADLRRSRP